MTGFGSAKVCEHDIDIHVEIKSVNSRYLDIRVSLPRELNFYEVELRKAISSSLKRGSIDIRVNLSDKREPKLKINKQKLVKYRELIREAAIALDINDNVSIEYLMNEPGVIEAENNLEDDPLLKLLLDRSVKEAISKIEISTKNEGEDIKLILCDSLSVINDALKKLEDSLEPYRKQLFENMHNRIKDILANYKLDTLEQRLIQELAIYIDKYDVQEELTRLYSHIDTFKKTISADSSNDIGKTLNFIIQEMQREANTLGSKYSTSLAFKYILTIKEEIEKDREIIQNVA